MSEAARSAVLASIADALRDAPAVELPPLDVAASDGAQSGADLARRFAEELAAVGGSAYLVDQRDDVPKTVADLVRSRSLQRVLVLDSPAARRAASALAQSRIADAALSAGEVAAADCSILSAESLLADTGSVVAVLRNRVERMLAYLPPTCVVIADADQLHPSMSAESLPAFFDPARADVRGEAVIITGPSRTADIEKLLVLGAHGPQQLIVVLSMETQARSLPRP